MADMHLTSLQREHEASRASKMRPNASKADFAPMQKDGFRNSKWAGFLKPTGYKPMIVLFWLFLIQQFSGIYMTLFYAVNFFQVNSKRCVNMKFLKPYKCDWFLRESSRLEVGQCFCKGWSMVSNHKNCIESCRAILLLDFWQIR